MNVLGSRGKENLSIWPKCETLCFPLSASTPVTAPEPDVSERLLHRCTVNPPTTALIAWPRVAISGFQSNWLSGPQPDGRCSSPHFLRGTSSSEKIPTIQTCRSRCSRVCISILITCCSPEQSPPLLTLVFAWWVNTQQGWSTQYSGIFFCFLSFFFFYKYIKIFKFHNKIEGYPSSEWSEC